MKRLKQLLAILMTAIMILTGTSLSSFGALSFAADDQDVTAAGQELQEESVDDTELQEESADATEAVQEETAAPAVDDSELVFKTIKANKVRLDGMMPEGAGATATDASSTKAVRKLETSEDGTVIAAYDITINADGEEYQPNSENPIQVQISNKAIKEDSDLAIWHILDDGTKEQIEDFGVENGKVTFDATGFSVYVIVEGPEPLPPSEDRYVQDLSELATEAAKTEPTGFYMSIVNGSTTRYLTNEWVAKGSGYVVNNTTDKTRAALWYCEPGDNENEYYFYTLAGGERRYIKVQNSTFLFNFNDTSAEPTAFTASLFGGAEGAFLFLHSGMADTALNYSGKNTGFKCYTDKNIRTNTDCKFFLAYPPEPPEKDPYGLDGKEYGIINYRGGTEATALLAKIKSNNNYRMDAKSVQVRFDPIKKSSGNLVIAKGEELPFWTFTSVREDIYTLSTKDNGTTKYLRIEGDSATITTSKDEYCEFKVVPCDGENAGKIRIVGNNGFELNNNGGKASNGFYGRNNYTGPDSRMTLIAPSDVYDDNDFVDYTAKKVSVSDTAKVHNGQTVIVYTRIWNEEKKRYDFYAIDHEGDLVYCYETGDHIMWTGARVNTMLWEFTEYYYEGTTNPNYYYELQNTYSGKYIAPKISGGVQTLSDNTIGINLEGRRNGEYSSNIIAWDDPQYDYAGLAVKPNSLELTAERLADAGTFYFAIMDEQQGTLTPVNTVDHKAAAGLTMKMVDYSNDIHSPEGSGSETSVEQWAVMGEQEYKQSSTNPGLLSSDIKENGYPTATKTDKSLRQLFDGHQSVKTVNHLFLKDTYEESGYFVYDSSQNFAHRAENDTDFTVYKELGTTNIPSHNDTLAHGQFMPYNNLDVPNAANLHPENLTDITGKDLPNDNPRKGETLYKYTEDPDHFFGMEINGNMVQTPSGKDKWGHDIIFEFTGDDDFWLYVDDLLVLDIGGIHKALSGSVNYSTGEVVVNGNHTTLREMFKSSYKSSHPGATSDEVEAFLSSKFRLKNGNYVFKDYSRHTIKIFYMERGGGASNLRMRFNLSPVKPGHVLLSKQLSGTNQDKYAGVEFPYQIYYRTDEGGPYFPAGSSGDTTTVRYQDTERDVKFDESATINGVQYSNVYYLKPDEVADIDLPDEAEDYYIVECGVDSDIYDLVEINGGTAADPDNKLTPESRGGTIYDYETKADTIDNRTKVIFTNHVDANSLRTIDVKKQLVDENGNPIEGDTTGFQFRVYLKQTPTTAGSGNSNTEFTEQDYYRLSPYYVKDPSGDYCRYDSTNKEFVSLGVSNFNHLTEEQKKQAKFTTSPSGAIDKIPTGYSFEIRDVLIGTSYKVEERSSELPEGYTFKTFNSEYDPNQDDITADSKKNIRVEAINEKGLGLTAKKIWSDADSTDYYEDIYLAVYDGNELLTVNRADLGLHNQKYIKRIRTHKNVPDKSVYFFIPAIPGKSLSNYSVREVKLTGEPEFDADTGFIKNYDGEVTPIDNNDDTQISSTSGETSATNRYTVTYNTGTPKDNTRTDTVTNTREGGIQLIKEDLNGTRLSDAVFTLKQGDTHFDPNKESLISDSNGVITTMYGYDKDVGYTLTEIEAPSGYTGLPASITIRVDGDTDKVTATGVPSDLIDVKQGSATTIPTITIKNRKSKFIVNKVDQAGRPLAGARFSLSRQIKDSKTGQYRKDYYPLTNFEELPTASGTTDDGVVMTAEKTKTLGAGNYYLTETQTPEGYAGIDGDLLFNISELGVVTVTTQAYSSYLKTTGTGTDTDPIVYELKVENTSTTPIAPTRYSSYILPFLMIMIGGLLLTATLYFRRRRGFEE